MDILTPDGKVISTGGPMGLDVACKMRDIDRYNRRVRWGP